MSTQLNSSNGTGPKRNLFGVKGKPRCQRCDQQRAKCVNDGLTGTCQRCASHSDPLVRGACKLESATERLRLKRGAVGSRKEDNEATEMIRSGKKRKTSLPNRDGVIDPQVSTEQRRIIEYWKARVQNCLPSYEEAYTELAKAFQSAKVQNEELVFWRERITERGSRGQTCTRMLVKAYGVHGDPAGAIEFWKSLLRQHAHDEYNSSIEVVAWYALKALFKTGVIASSEVVALCRLRITELKSDWRYYTTLYELPDRLDLSTDDRISFWKGMLHFESDNAGHKICVAELKRALAEKGGMSGALEYWKVLIRKFPESLELSAILQEEFEMEGKEEIAVEFWTKLQKRYPEVRHFTQYLAKNYKSIGDYESAIRAWTTVLDDLIGDDEDYVDVDNAIEELDEILYFERDSTQRVQYWRDSLDRMPAENSMDTRLRNLATALLQRSSELPVHARLNELKLAAIACPKHKEVAQALRVEFGRVDGEGDEEEKFWRQVLETSQFRDPWRLWPHIRLAEYCFARGDYDEALAFITHVVGNPYYYSIEVWNAIVEVIPPNSFEFACDLVRAAPSSLYTPNYLEKVCVDPSRSYLQTWQTLCIENRGESSQLSQAVASAMRRENVEVPTQIQYWKSMVQRFPESRGAREELKKALSAAEGTPGDIASLELNTWRSIFRHFMTSPPPKMPTDLAHSLYDASVQFADKTLSMDFWFTGHLWYVAKDEWAWILCQFAGAGNDFTETVQMFFKEACALSEILAWAA